MKKELALDKQLIQLIQLACKAGQLQKAIDIVLSLHHKASFDGAAKIAGFYQLVGLQEKIEKVKEVFSERERRVEARERRENRYSHAAPLSAPSFGESSTRGRLGSDALQTGMKRPLRLAQPETTNHQSLENSWGSSAVDSPGGSDSHKRKWGVSEENESQSTSTSETSVPAPKRRVLASDEVSTSSHQSEPRLSMLLLLLLFLLLILLI